jgi:hypothetical protein
MAQNIPLMYILKFQAKIKLKKKSDGVTILSRKNLKKRKK